MKHYLQFLLLSLMLTTLPAVADMNRVTLIHGQKIFVSGINVAWDKFGGDVGSQPLDTAWFATMLNGVQDSGGNAIRWWLFTNLSNAPTFDATTKLVNGPGSATIANIRKVLDMAHARGIVVDLCLLSFDMMKTSEQGVDTAANRKVLQTDEGRAAFINNALIPVVTAIGKHPAILCWEIFNEPEGMVKTIAGDWGNIADGIMISDVQKMVNQATGAIHRAMPGVPVSNGSWAFIASSFTVPGDKNYYSDSALTLVGGDAEGTLDFYMVHYYEWAGHVHSPFHHPASYWGLDKPIVIAEFPAKGLSDSLGPMSPAQAWQALYDGGYAGAMGWCYTAHDGFGGLPEAGQGTRWLQTTHPSDAIINFPPQGMNDFYIATAGVKLSVAAPGILSNDFLPTATTVLHMGGILTQPLHGTLNANTDGSFDYTSNAGFRGFDSFIYQVVDQAGASSQAQANIQIFDPDTDKVVVPSTATNWTVYAAWGTFNITQTTAGPLSANLAAYGAPALWMVGNSSTQVNLDANISYTIIATVQNDPTSPWDTLKFHPTNAVGNYGPTDTSANMITLAPGSLAANGFQEFVGTISPTAAMTLDPALEMLWIPSGGHGPNSNHSTLVRSLVIVPTASVVAIRQHATPAEIHAYLQRYDLLGRHIHLAQ